MSEGTPELVEPIRSLQLSRRNFLKLAGVGTGAVLVSNSLLGEYEAHRLAEIPPVPKALSDYQIAWQARPWVWINLAIASERIDGTIINPGEQVSINTLLGFADMADVSRENTDPRKGYIAAQMSDPTKLDGWGYGLCLGSTAIFRASLESPLLIPERGTHYDIYQDYFKDMPIGTDAAVFKPDPGDELQIETDLVLKNPTDKPVTLRFLVFDAKGNRLPVPDSEVSQVTYKAAIAEHLVRMLRKKIADVTGATLPRQYVPEYIADNNRIHVYAAITGENDDYKVQVGDVTKTHNEHPQYTFERKLILHPGQEEQKEFTEAFTSQYQ